MDIRKLLSSKKVLVVGDIILDHYVYGKVYRVSPEAPVPVVLKNRSVYCLGGAANVAQNVTSFGSECYLLGVTGNDQSSLVLDDLLKQQSISPFLVKDSSRPTTEKTRIVGSPWGYFARLWQGIIFTGSSTGFNFNCSKGR